MQSKRGNLRKAVFIVVYSVDKDNGIEYAILKRKKHWKGWEFPKGGIEKGESLVKTARRESFEEVNLKPLKIKNFNISGKYNYSKALPDRPGIVGQTYHLFAVEVKKGNIKVDKREHYFGKWMDFDKAKKIITHTNQKKCLTIINKWLTKNK